jgi:predicted small lipoprotein YifL
MIVILSLLLIVSLSSCATAKPYYFNDSDKIITGKAGAAPPVTSYDWVLMSQGKYRDITTAVITK